VPTVLAYKSIIVFCKSFCFHSKIQSPFSSCIPS
jgi:hypothetical protein